MCLKPQISNRSGLLKAGNIKWGSIIVPLTSCLTGLNQSVLQIKTKIVSCHTADSKPVKQDVNRTVILPPLVFPARGISVSKNIIFNKTRALVESANKAGELARQVGCLNRCACFNCQCFLQQPLRELTFTRQAISHINQSI